jgi:uncharacterized protein (TIGR01589 family)
MSTNRSYHNHNFDQSSTSNLNFANLLSSQQSSSPQLVQQQPQLPQQNIQSYVYAQNTGLAPHHNSYGLQQNNQNPLVSMLGNSTTGGANALLQSLNMPPQLQQQVQQIQQQQMMQQQQQRRSYTQQQIREVQGMIEKCLTMYLTKDEVIAHLQGIEPYVIKLVWLKLEEQNPEFFHSYNIRLQIKSQIDMFNTLVKDQASLMSQQQQQLQQLNTGNTMSVNTSTSQVRQSQPQQQLTGPQQTTQQVPILNPQPASNTTAATNPNTSGPYGSSTSSLIYSLLANNSNPQQQTNANAAPTTIRQQPSPFPQLSNPQQQYSQTQQIQEQIQRQLAAQRRLGSVGSNDMFSMLLTSGNNTNDLSNALLQQQSHNQFTQNNTNLYNQFNSSTNTLNDLSSTLLQQTQQHAPYGQYTGPGGGGIGTNLDTQILSGLLHAQQQTQQTSQQPTQQPQQIQYTANLYNNMNNYQFPNNNNNNNNNNQNMVNQQANMNKPNNNMGLIGNQMGQNFGNIQLQSDEELTFPNFGANDSADLLLGLEGDPNESANEYGSIIPDEFESDAAIGQLFRRQDNVWD